MTGLPVNDPQFWIVTGVAAAVLAFGLWRVVRFFRRNKRKEKSVSLTIERKEPQ